MAGADHNPTQANAFSTERLATVPRPLGEDPAAEAGLDCPPALFGWLFGDMPLSRSESPCDPDSPCRLYAVADAGRVFGLVERIETSGLNHRCLYSRDAEDDVSDVAPWLVELRPGNRLVRNFFSAPSPGAKPAPWHMWPKAPALYIRSRLDIEALRKHLRRFTVVTDETGGEAFLRFWDPLCFEDMMTAFGPTGAEGLFAQINSFVVYHSRAALRLSRDAMTPVVPCRITHEGRDRYKSLRQARLTEAIVDHFLSLPEFRNDDRAQLRQEVSRYLERGRELGIRDARGLHSFALGLALIRDDKTTRRQLGTLFLDDTVPLAERRHRITGQLDHHIEQAKAALAVTGQ